MAKVKPYEIDPGEKRRTIKDLFEVISGLRTKDEIINFFLGLFTASEALMIARRIQIAKMLIEDNSYEEIKEKLKVSSQTIHKTDQWLHNSDDLQNNWLVDRIKGAEKKKIKRDSRNYSGSLLNKYAHHRFWKDLF